jgi:ATP-binding cassette subfamily F protein 3
VLDEPTNHLDMMSKEILKNALNQFEGTVIIVSHDRDFLHGLTNKTFEFTRDGIKEHIGDIHEFLEKKQMEDMRMLAKKDEVKKQEPKNKNQEPRIKNQDNNSLEAKKEKEKELKKLKSELEKSEKKVSELESQLAEMNKKLQDPQQFQELGKDPGFFSNYDALKKQLEEEMGKWESLSAAIERQ